MGIVVIFCTGHSAVLNSLHKAISLLPPPGELAERGKHLSSVKLNVVMIKGVNDEELPAFIDLARRERVGIRFIEYMPFDGQLHCDMLA